MDTSTQEARDKRARELQGMPKFRLAQLYRHLGCLNEEREMLRWSHGELVTSVLSAEFPQPRPPLAPGEVQVS